MHNYFIFAYFYICKPQVYLRFMYTVYVLCVPVCFMYTVDLELRAVWAICAVCYFFLLNIGRYNNFIPVFFIIDFYTLLRWIHANGKLFQILILPTRYIFTEQYYLGNLDINYYCLNWMYSQLTFPRVCIFNLIQ